jgi:hypothetical protein
MKNTMNRNFPSFLLKVFFHINIVSSSYNDLVLKKVFLRVLGKPKPKKIKFPSKPKAIAISIFWKTFSEITNKKFMEFTLSFWPSSIFKFYQKVTVCRAVESRVEWVILQRYDRAKITLFLILIVSKAQIIWFILFTKFKFKMCWGIQC